MRYSGTISRGVRTPIIKKGDDLASIVVESVCNCVKEANIELHDKDVVAITEAVVGISQGNYATADQIAQDVKNKFQDELFVGFKTIEEKNVFTKFISVKGIGPKTAINALKDTTIDKFKEMIINEDIKGLKKLSGIGPKAAGQIILDLKGSLKQSSLSSIESKTKFNKEQEDAISVLKSLGFKGKDIEDILNKLPEVLSASEYVNEVLKRLGNK